MIGSPPTTRWAMLAFVLNVAASVVGGIILAWFLKQVSEGYMAESWYRYWPELIGLLFVGVWLGGYFVYRAWSGYTALRSWLVYAPATDIAADQDQNLYMRIKKRIQKHCEATQSGLSGRAVFRLEWLVEQGVVTESERDQAEEGLAQLCQENFLEREGMDYHIKGR